MTKTEGSLDAHPGDHPKDRQAPGPKPEHVSIEGDWEEAVKNALKKPPPPKQGSITVKKKPPEK